MDRADRRRARRPSLGEWLRSVRASASTRDLMAIMARVTWGCEPDDVSMLHAARYVKAAGGLDRMLDVEGGAQQDRFPAGTQQIAMRMAEELGDRVVLGAPVRRIERHGDGTLTVACGLRAVSTPRSVIVAIPPAAPRRHRVRSAAAARVRQARRHWPQGHLSKAYAAYDTPFWRDNGCSGEALSDEGPVFITFDVSPATTGPGSCWGSSMPARSTRCRAEQRRERALAGFAALFGDAALETPSTISIIVGAQSNSHPAGRPRRCRRDRGQRTGRGCASRSDRSSGPAPRPPTNGPASSTARSAPVQRAAAEVHGPAQELMRRCRESPIRPATAGAR